MARKDALKAEGIVVEVLPNGTYRVELANGHRVLAWGAKRAGLAGLPVGKKVVLGMSPFDLSTGQFVVEKKN
jgi:translation initiation factor IF-1